ncbi:MAG: amino acid ABC transporter permease [Neomegalonema sp.]|nr:amino acid ABC transporter permease [Neomegalonema sp.]
MEELGDKLRFFEIYRNPEYMWLLADGAAVSAALTTAAGMLGFAFAVILAGARTSGYSVVAAPAAVFVEVFRNTPLIVQLFFIAFGLPTLFGYALEFWQHALISLTLNFSAYFAEILRAGFKAVPLGQIEGARALGLRRRSIFWKVIFPQATAKMFPSLNSQFIFLFLTTGIISEIGVNDLTKAGFDIDKEIFRTFEVFIILTVGYILLSLAFKGILQLIDNHFFKWKRAR